MADVFNNSNDATVSVDRHEIEVHHKPSNGVAAMPNNSNVEETTDTPDAMSTATQRPSVESSSLLPTIKNDPLIAIEELLNLAQTSESPTLQLPTALVADFLSSVRQAREELSEVKQELKDVQMSNGILFPLFKKLPPEVRLMIWRTALLKSRVIALQVRKRHLWLGPNIRSWKPSSSCSIRQVCKEARGEAEKFQTALFLEETPHHREYHEIHRPVIYLNRSIDTVFLDRDAYDCVWNLIHDSTLIPSIPSLAIEMWTWLQFQRRLYFTEFMNDLSLMGVEELHIVVDKPRALATTDITLLTPKAAPEKLLPNHEFRHDPSSALSTPNMSPVTWQSLEDMHLRDIAKYKAETNFYVDKLDRPWTIKKIHYV